MIISLALSIWAALSISNLVHERDKERQAQIDQAATEVREAAIVQCESRNQARAEDKTKDLYWLNFIISISRDPNLAVSTFKPLLDYTETANDPLDCNYDSPTFGTDTSPPPTIVGQ